MNFEIPATGMQAATAAFEKAANGISRAFSGVENNLLGARSTADSVDLSTSVVSLLEAKNNFAANVKTALVDNEIMQNTFSIVG